MGITTNLAVNADPAVTDTSFKEDLSKSYSLTVWRQLRRSPLGLLGIAVLALFVVIAIYAPILASSKPLVVNYDGIWYFPLWRYLFYSGFYTKYLDLFFNLMMFTMPLALLATWRWYHDSKKLWIGYGMVALLQIFGFSMLLVRPVQDPAADAKLASERRQVLKNARHGILPAAGLPQPGEWAFDLQYMTPYTRLNTVLRYRQRMKQHQHLMMYKDDYTSTMQERRSDSGIQDLDQLSSITLPTLWQMERNNEDLLLERYHQQMATAQPDSAIYRHASAAAQWLKDRKQWLEQQSLLVRAEVMPLLRPYHWEDDAGGEQTLNRYIGWLDLTRVNRKDLMAALLFGTRISLVVGVIAVSLALIIGIPIGAIAGYYGGSTDILISRLLEIWETMPAFLMLLMIVAMAQSKSIFLVITVIGIFGWTTFSRYIRGEFLKQRNLTYVEACRCLGFGDARIVFNHILPNAIPPILTLLPFAIMGAIASEAGLSFLGLGEEGSCSWGVLMDEGRTAFPGESYLLWPPAILLTILLVATALVGDAMRDALDPKLRR